MQASRNFICFAIELSASVQNSEHHFRGGTLFGGVHIDRNAAAIVDYSYGIIGVNSDVNFIGVATHRFVNRVVDDFPNQVMQTHFAGGTDVHCWAEAHSFQAAENFDRLGIVLMTGLHRNCFFIAHLFSLALCPRCGLQGTDLRLSHHAEQSSTRSRLPAMRLN